MQFINVMNVKLKRIKVKTKQNKKPQNDHKKINKKLKKKTV